MTPTRLCLLAALSLALTACPSEPSTEDGGTTEDSGSPDGSVPTTNCPAGVVCPSDTCLTSGTCACLDNTHCSGATPQCDTATKLCVGCLENDHCSGATPQCDTTSKTCKPCTPSGGCGPHQFCDIDFTCKQGCSGDDACRSGQCLGTRDCADCTSDLECSAGKLCGTGTCGEACTQPGDCANGLDCCNGRCVDKAQDIDHCGACNQACTQSQFCDGTQCRDVRIQNVCQNPVVRILTNAFVHDTDAGMSIGNALASSCSPAVTSATLHPPPYTGVLDGGTGEPLTRGGVTLVVAGGSFGQKLVDYVETSGIAPVYDSSDETTSSFTSHDAGVVASTLRANIGPSHDFFLIELVRDPVRGSLALIAYGLSESGTDAAAYHWVNQMMPNLGSLDQAWYLYEWVDDTTPGPSAGDTFTLLGSGL